MSYLRHTFLILDDPGEHDGDAVGPEYRVVPSDLDDIDDAAQKWLVFVNATQSGGATSPTTDVIVETSFDDGGSWVEVAKATQLTGDGGAPELIELTALGPRIRASKVLGGGTKPNSSAVVRLASNGMFKVQDNGW